MAHIFFGVVAENRWSSRVGFGVGVHVHGGVGFSGRLVGPRHGRVAGAEPAGLSQVVGLEAPADGAGERVGEDGRVLSLVQLPAAGAELAAGGGGREGQPREVHGGLRRQPRGHGGVLSAVVQLVLREPGRQGSQKNHKASTIIGIHGWDW